MNFLLNPVINKVLVTLDDNMSMTSVVLRDGVDNVGRAHQAFQRDNHDGRERVIEENLTTLIWGFGIRFMKERIYDPIARKLGLPYPAFDMGLLKDGPQKLTADVVKRYAPDNRHLLDLVGKPEVQKLYHQSNVIKFLVATGLPILLIAFGIPTFNQWLTRKKIAQEKDRQAPGGQAHPPGMRFGMPPQPLQRPTLYQPFEGKQTVKSACKYGHPLFGGLGDSLAVGVSNLLQNERANTLLVDSVISGGRTYKARNKFERLEVIFQEASIIFFLYYAQSMIQRFVEKWMDKLSGSISGMGFGELKHLREAYGDDAARFMSGQKQSLSPFKQWLSADAMPEAFEKALVENAREYVAQGKSGDLLMEMAQKAGKIPVVKTAEGKLMPDLTRKIQADGIFKTARQLDKLARHLEAGSGSGMQTMLSRSMNGKFAAFAVSSAICTLFLGWVIPRTKQWMTYQLTGSKAFPGTMDLKH